MIKYTSFIYTQHINYLYIHILNYRWIIWSLSPAALSSLSPPSSQSILFNLFINQNQLLSLFLSIFFFLSSSFYLLLLSSVFSPSVFLLIIVYRKKVFFPISNYLMILHIISMLLLKVRSERVWIIEEEGMKRAWFSW